MSKITLQSALQVCLYWMWQFYNLTFVKYIHKNCYNRRATQVHSDNTILRLDRSGLNASFHFTFHPTHDWDILAKSRVHCVSTSACWYPGREIRCSSNHLFSLKNIYTSHISVLSFKKYVLEKHVFLMQPTGCVEMIRHGRECLL